MPGEPGGVATAGFAARGCPGGCQGSESPLGQGGQWVRDAGALCRTPGLLLLPKLPNLLGPHWRCALMSCFGPEEDLAVPAATLFSDVTLPLKTLNLVVSFHPVNKTPA